LEKWEWLAQSKLKASKSRPANHALASHISICSQRIPEACQFFAEEREN
jgi:hypothetical protein